MASLNDWVPDTSGSLTGRFRVRGVWPKLTIEGAADGNRIVYRSKAAEGSKPEDLLAVGKVHVTATVDTPLDPAGKLEVVANRIRVAGWSCASARVAGSGNQAKHRATLDADGEKLDVGVTLAGGITGTGWSGELSRLSLNAPDLAKLALRSPARVVYDAGDFSISESCFANDDGSVCLAANLKQSGALEASYRIETCRWASRTCWRRSDAGTAARRAARRRQGAARRRWTVVRRCPYRFAIRAPDVA